jgi:lysosomal acid phosphatase
LISKTVLNSAFISGHVTNRGLLNSYNFGQYLKNYYGGFMTPAYNPSRVYARSIDVDRSLMSANTLLSGMYPPSTSEQLWSPSVTWFPIPIHTTEAQFDQVRNSFFLRIKKLIY